MPRTIDALKEKDIVNFRKYRIPSQKILEKEMATHSSTLAWRIPGMEEPGGLPSMGSHRVRHDWSDLAAAAARKSLHLTKRNINV